MRRTERNENRLFALRFLVPVLFVFLWLLVPAFKNTPEYLLPRLPRVAFSFYDFVTGTLGLNGYAGTFWKHSWASLQRVWIGFGIAVATGSGLGIVSGYFRTVRELFDPFLQAIRMIPGIGWFPIAMVWFGVGTKTTVFLIALAAFFPIYLNTVQAVEDTPVSWIHAGRVLGADTKDVFFTIILPSALPGIFSGLRIGMGLCWAYLVLGELTGVNEGLGAVMMNARMLGSIEIIVVCMIAIALWGRVSDLFLSALFRRWRPELRRGQ